MLYSHYVGRFMPSEFAALLDIALGKGIRHSDILGLIHSRIISEYTRKYPKAPISTTPVVDEQSGTVHLVSEGKDVTPSGFKDEAASLARQVIIEAISHTESTQVPVREDMRNTPGIIPGFTPPFSFSAVLFWIYNGLFGIYNIFLGLTFIPYLLSASFNSVGRSTLVQQPSANLLAGLILLLLPYVCLFIVIRGKLYTHPGLLGKILFWGEVPLVVLTLPVMFMPSLPSSLGLFWLFGLSLPLVFITSEEKSGESRWGLLLRSFAFVVVGYLSLLLLLVLPLLVSSIFTAAIDSFRWVIRPPFSSGDLMLPTYPRTPAFSFGTALTLLFSALGLFGGLFLSIVPFALPVLLGLLVWKAGKTVAAKYSKRTAVIWAGIPFAVLTLVFVGSLFSSSSALLKALATFHDAGTFTDKMEKAVLLTGKEKEVGSAITEWSTLSAQYPFKDGDTWLSAQYRNKLHLPESVAKGLESIFYSLASPFVYKSYGVTAEQLYTNYQAVYGVPFGTTISATVPSSKNVEIVTRQISAVTGQTSLFATVTYEEEYRNTTSTEQEVIYEFSLPADAVVTDLDLGPELEYQGQIAPRGAARRTYEQQLVRRRDPALIEQVGPRQYRLRVFPIPGTNDRTTLNGRNQKVRFTYVTPVGWSGIPLPAFSKKQNMTELNLKQTATVNGKILAVDQENSIIPDTAQRMAYCNDQVKFGTQTFGGVAVTFGFDDKTNVCAGQAKVLPQRSDKSLALVIDISAANSKVLTGYLEKLFKDNETFLQGGMADVYYANNSGISDLIPLTKGSFIPPKAFFGLPPTLSDLQTIAKNYDAVILLTGNTQPIFTDSADERGVRLNQPVFIYHVYGKIPTYPDTVTTSLLASGGTVVDSLAEAYYRLPKRLGEGELARNGWFWLRSQGSPISQGSFQGLGTNIVKPTNPLPEKRESVSPEEAISVKQAIYAGIRLYSGGDLWADIPKLDAFNSQAQAAGIVTPFSSSLALVNSIQQMQLDQQSQGTGRYETDSVQPPVMPVMPLRITNTAPMMDMFSTNSLNTMEFKSSGIANPAMGAITGGGSLNMGTPMGYSSYGGGSFGLSLLSGGGMVTVFILLNIVVFLGGLVISVPRFLRSMKKKR